MDAGVVTDELWEKWKAMEWEISELEVDDHGDRWIELVDDAKMGLGVVRREEEIGKEFSLWRRKEVVEGGLESIRPEDAGNGYGPGPE